MKIKTTVFALYTDTEEDGMQLRVYPTTSARWTAVREMLNKELNEDPDDDTPHMAQLRGMLNGNATTEACLEYFRDVVRHSMDTWHLEDVELIAVGELIPETDNEKLMSRASTMMGALGLAILDCPRGDKNSLCHRGLCPIEECNRCQRAEMVHQTFNNAMLAVQTVKPKVLSPT